jgi:dTDP-glucose 4,6-dehydratase
MKTILVTGGNGFIGTNFIRILNEHNVIEKYNIINVDKLTYAANKNSLSNIKDVVSYKVDITDRDSMEKIFTEHKIDYVVNFAAETHVDNSIKDPSCFVKTNVLGTGVLLDCAKKFEVLKYLQVSTDEVYGSIENGQFTENSPIDPSSPYSASKAGADHLVMSYHKTFKLPVNITRCSNNYGQFQHSEKLIPTIINKALKDEKIPIYGTGTNIRDWIHVRDHARAVLMVLLKGQNGEIYNVGSNNELTNLEITHKILSLMKKPESLIEFVEDRKGHDLRYAIDSTKIQNQLGWFPKIDFESGLENTINWYYMNKSI